MARIRLILLGAVAGLTWAASLRGYMMVLAGPTSAFTFSGTFGIILPSGTFTGALLGWGVPAPGRPPVPAAHRHPAAAGPDPEPADSLARPCSRHPRCARDDRRLRRVWPRPAVARSAAGVIALAAVFTPFAVPEPNRPDLSASTAPGLWSATLLSSLYVVFAVASSIPMRLPNPFHPAAGSA